jgi:hypothetical protein
MYIITTIGKLDIDPLLFVDISFPGDGTQQDGFPNSLSEYLQVMKDVSVHIHQSNWLRMEKFRKYRPFLSDFQPWARMLSTFLRRYYSSDVPSIEKITSYATYIAPYEKEIKEMLADCDVSNVSDRALLFVQKKSGGKKSKKRKGKKKKKSRKFNTRVF